ncbi:single-stranded DNA-binding protein [Kitasatospora sp. NPDC001175]|uniref:single-stranded DNA-binding protein n=1 Tax=Kitasatospora sp. NPDC001175 TaxID=3157103 RepID=UPI003D036B97
MSAPITLTGRLGADPELRFSSNGTAIARISIVTSRRVKNEQTGEWSDADVTWWDCTAFRALAENAVGSLGKGMAVVAVGRAVQENWEDKTGAKRSKIAVRLDSIGPDLTRATAHVEKSNSQAQGGQKRPSRPVQNDPWASPTPTQDGWEAPRHNSGSEEQPPF